MTGVGEKVDGASVEKGGDEDDDKDDVVKDGTTGMVEEATRDESVFSMDEKGKAGSAIQAPADKSAKQGHDQCKADEAREDVDGNYINCNVYILIGLVSAHLRE
ncbi:unnamed protein product [Somion occarium]|uniref:Uncharacterized protein n=1 Tax=Somion occarium TaxID=3059160 RepID=A0ABP1DG89_9APHY